MSKRSVHVSGIARIAPPVVELVDGARVQLDPADAGAAQLADLLVKLQQLSRPVYLEVDGATGTIRRLLIPLIARVVELRTDAGGDCQVTLEPSAARHRLRQSLPGFLAIESELQSCLASGDPAVVTEDDAHDILHARRFLPGRDGPPPPLPPPRP